MIFHVDGGSRTSKNHGKLCLKPFAPVLLVLCFALAPLASLRAQSEDHAYRRVTHSQKPVYPDILKLLNISGTVRLKVKVLANGTVAGAEIMGGNPILAESAVKAVMAWKYTPVPSTTVEIATIDFNVH